jgi:heme exporter protein CcmD
MSYTPFILAAYLIGAAVLLWTAMAPVLHKRTLLRQLKARQARMDKSQ